MPTTTDPPRATTPAESEYGDDSPPTQPRIHAADDCRRVWPVAADRSPRDEEDSGVQEVSSPPDYAAGIARVCDDLKALLLEKNYSYGNSIFKPINIFSDLAAEEAILVRIDDKISRIANRRSYPGDNDVKDLAGYLICLMVLREMEHA